MPTKPRELTGGSSSQVKLGISSSINCNLSSVGLRRCCSIGPLPLVAARVTGMSVDLSCSPTGNAAPKLPNYWIEDN
ncbi:unnamed protein product [Cuscuta campestris]|uniref:Uncharacterized protein n=1 Tax=Cuscuta campestris TaxID=132261 RepID=A0A484KXC4_9ASTE|nr:unnamed protein product [Cuscuta campestris]